MTLSGSSRRAQTIDALRSNTYDVLIAGGGINGAGVARDLALRAKTSGRPLRIALAEKHHYGSGTSGRNSHLIHGGLRYLKYLNIPLVREALQERATLLRIAPHLVEPLQFILPFENWTQAMFYRAGLLLYDKLAGQALIEPHRALNRAELHAFDGDLQSGRFQSGATFYDARVSAARLVLENVIEAVANGVAAANYLEIIERRRSGDVWEVLAQDRISSAGLVIRARTIVDATGAWSDAGVRLVRGSHIIVPYHGVPHKVAREHAVAYFEDSGRIVFFIPWGEARNLLLIGTTDVDHNSGPENVRISREEIQYLLDVTRKVLRDGSAGEPIASFSSLRPLVHESGRSATSTSREHRIWRDNDGVIRIVGGKYTTYRKMSEEAADLAVPELRGQSTTARTPLNGNSPDAIARLTADSAAVAARHRVPETVVRRYIKTYGVRLPEFLDSYYDEEEAAPVAFAARHELAERLSDVLFVSTTWGYESRWDFVRLLDLASRMGRYLDWEGGRIDVEVQHTLRLIEEQGISPDPRLRIGD
jgi:glycerol-3-phosphate dehydrogenase